MHRHTDTHAARGMTRSENRTFFRVENRSRDEGWLPAALLPVRISDPAHPRADMLLYHGHHFGHSLLEAPFPYLPHWLLFIGLDGGPPDPPRGMHAHVTHRDGHSALNAFWLLSPAVSTRLEAHPSGATIVLFVDSQGHRQSQGNALCAGRAENELAAYSSADDPLRRELGDAVRATLARQSALPGGYLAQLAMTLAAHLLHSPGCGSLPPARRRGGAGATVRYIREHIDAHLAADLSLAALASLVALSPHHLAHTFSEVVGQPLHQYVLARRLEEAMRLLRQGGRSVAEVARAVGFADQSHLARQFKRRFGLSPAAVGKERKI